MDNHCFFFGWRIADTIRCRLVFESVRGNPLWPDLIRSDQTNRIKQRKGTELQQMSYLYMLCCILIFMMKRVTVCGKGIFHSTQFCINSIFFGLGYELEADRQSALLFIFHNSVLTNWWLCFSLMIIQWKSSVVCNSAILIFCTYSVPFEFRLIKKA